MKHLGDGKEGRVSLKLAPTFKPENFPLTRYAVPRVHVSVFVKSIIICESDRWVIKRTCRLSKLISLLH